MKNRHVDCTFCTTFFIVAAHYHSIRLPPLGNLYIASRNTSSETMPTLRRNPMRLVRHKSGGYNEDEKDDDGNNNNNDGNSSIPWSVHLAEHDDRCAICKDPYHNGTMHVATNCRGGHIFHRRCWVKFVRSANGRRLRCPLCRDPIQVTELVEVIVRPEPPEIIDLSGSD